MAFRQTTRVLGDLLLSPNFRQYSMKSAFCFACIAKPCASLASSRHRLAAMFSASLSVSLSVSAFTSPR